MRGVKRKNIVGAHKGRVPAGSESVRAPISRASRAERYAAGKALREACPREAHGVWKAPSGRRDENVPPIGRRVSRRRGVASRGPEARGLGGGGLCDSPRGRCCAAGLSLKSVSVSDRTMSASGSTSESRTV